MVTADDFADPACYVATPRITALAATVDGSRVVATVATPAPDNTRYVTAAWEIDPAGGRAARRLTFSDDGETVAGFLPDRGLLFTSTRPLPATRDEEAPDGKDDVAALWLLPADGAEARPVLRRPGGIGSVSVARQVGAVVVSAATLPGGEEAQADATRRRERRKAGVSAILHEQAPVRHWDHDLGPAAPSLFVAADVTAGEPELRPLTPDPGRALDEAAFTVTADGSTVLTDWVRQDRPGLPTSSLVAVDVATGERRVLAQQAGMSYGGPAVSPDGRWVACRRERHPSYDEPPDVTVWLVDLDTGEGRDLTPTLDLWPGPPVFTADSAAVLFAADDRGHAPIFRAELADGRVTRLTAAGAYTDICPAPDAVYALRSSLGHPPQPVRLDPATADQTPVALPAPGAVESLPSRLEEVSTTAADGTRIRAWLVLPAGASAEHPAPLALWAHGGPMSSWNAWSWRWCPHVLAAHGWAVLLPDPALSTGYGQDMIRRGWGQWGGAPYDDLMTVTDAVLLRPDLDPARTAAMGGSYGGYMANWIAGHTDRFRAIVTHASLWALDQFQGTTDTPAWWELEWGDVVQRPERYEKDSPHRHADAITTPMLVIHGDRDYRVPIGEGLRLWNDLVRRGVQAKFLYFPDENHWILKPGNARVWYESVLAFLAHHVLDQEWHRPSLL